MRFARVHKVVSYLLAALGLIALCAGGEMRMASTLFLMGGFVLSWFAEGPLLHSTRYVRAWNILVVLTLVLEILRALLFGLAPLTAAVEFASMLQLSRLANRRTARDYQQITVLAMLHLIAATVLGGGLSYAACFLGFVIVTPWALTLGHLRREIEGNYLADARAGRSGVPIDVARILRSRRVVGPGLLAGSALLAVPIFAMTAVVFILFPRIGLGIFSLRSSRGGPVAGLGSQVELSGHGTIRNDPTVVLRIEPPDLGSDPPQIRIFRLRGAAFDHYNGHAWTRRNSQFHTVRREGATYELRRWPVDRVDRPFKIILDAIDPPVILVPVGTVAIRVEPRVEAGIPRYPDVTLDRLDELRYSSNDDLGIVYTAYAANDALHQGDGTYLDPDQYEPYLQLPDVSPELVALAHKLTDGYETPVQKARAVEEYLLTFRYTLTLESGGAARPIEDFLFRTHAGHCEYFSTAMAVLLRAAGVATRNVTGFLGGVYNRYGHFYAVRQGDAHSWVEIYDPSHGWVTFDPTPPSREATTEAGGVWAEFEAFIEALRVRWRRYIVGFDLNIQARLARNLMKWLDGDSNGQRGMRKGADLWKARLSRIARTPAVWVILGSIAAVVAAVIIRRRWRRSPVGYQGARSNQSHIREAIALARSLDKALAARGYARPPARTPMAFADELATRGLPFAQLAQTVAQRYAEARFGDRPLTSEEADRLRQALRQAPTAT